MLPGRSRWWGVVWFKILGTRHGHGESPTKKRSFENPRDRTTAPSVNRLLFLYTLSLLFTLWIDIGYFFSIIYDISQRIALNRSLMHR